jgi:nucleoside-diphosphate-sugar epimerase
LLVPGDGANRVAVTHVDNLVHAVERALATQTPGGVYNIADAIAPTVHELLTTMFARYNVPVSITYVPRPVAYAAALAFETAWSLLQRTTDPPLTRYVVQSLADAFPLEISEAITQLQYEPQYTYVNGPL